MKKISILIISILFLTTAIISVNAAGIGDAFNQTSTSPLSQTATGAGYHTGESNNIEAIVQTGINAALSFLGVIFIILIIYAGITWMTAEGAEEKISKAKKLLKGSIIGLIIVLAAYALTYTLFTYFIETTLIYGE